MLSNRLLPAELLFALLGVFCLVGISVLKVFVVDYGLEFYFYTDGVTSIQSERTLSYFQMFRTPASVWLASVLVVSVMVSFAVFLEWRGYKRLAQALLWAAAIASLVLATVLVWVAGFVFAVGAALLIGAAIMAQLRAKAAVARIG